MGVNTHYLFTKSFPYWTVMSVITHYLLTKAQFMVVRFQKQQAKSPLRAIVPLLACLRVSPNFYNYLTKLRKPHAARKAVNGINPSLPCGQ